MEKTVPRQALDDATYVAGEQAIELALTRRKLYEVVEEANEETERLATLLVDNGIDPATGHRIDKARREENDNG